MNRWTDESIGVGDGIRTRDVQIHSLALYQLSYTHRRARCARDSIITFVTSGGEECQLSASAKKGAIFIVQTGATNRKGSLLGTLLSLREVQVKLPTLRIFFRNLPTRQGKPSSKV